MAVDSVKQKLSFTPVPGSLRPAMTKTVSAPQVSVSRLDAGEICTGR